MKQDGFITQPSSLLPSFSFSLPYHLYHPCLPPPFVFFSPLILHPLPSLFFVLFTLSSLSLTHSLSSPSSLAPITRGRSAVVAADEAFCMRTTEKNCTLPATQGDMVKRGTHRSKKTGLCFPGIIRLV